jgi:hypothetical protein
MNHIRRHRGSRSKKRELNWINYLVQKGGANKGQHGNNKQRVSCELLVFDVSIEENYGTACWP